MAEDIKNNEDEKNFKEGYEGKSSVEKLKQQAAENYNVVKDYVKDKLSDIDGKNTRDELIKSSMEFYDKYGVLPESVSKASPTELLKEAYDAQKKARDENPVIDAALSFVPVANVATSADDMVNSIKDKDYSKAALDVLGVIPSEKFITKASQATLDLLKNKIDKENDR